MKTKLFFTTLSTTQKTDPHNEVLQYTISNTLQTGNNSYCFPPKGLVRLLIHPIQSLNPLPNDKI